MMAYVSDQRSQYYKWDCWTQGQCYDRAQLWILSGHSGHIAALQINSGRSPLTPVALVQLTFH